MAYNGWYAIKPKANHPALFRQLVSIFIAFVIISISAQTILSICEEECKGKN